MCRTSTRCSTSYESMPNICLLIFFFFVENKIWMIWMFTCVPSRPGSREIDATHSYFVFNVPERYYSKTTAYRRMSTEFAKLFFLFFFFGRSASTCWDRKNLFDSCKNCRWILCAKWRRKGKKIENIIKWWIEDHKTSNCYHFLILIQIKTESVRSRTPSVCHFSISFGANRASPNCANIKHNHPSVRHKRMYDTCDIILYFGI